MTDKVHIADMNYNDLVTCFGNASKESEESDSKSRNQNSEGPIDISIIYYAKYRRKSEEREEAQTNE
jgi:hypothetical protein